LSQGRTQGRPKCALDSLEVAKCLHPQNGWRQRHYRRDSPKVAKLGWLQKLTHVPLAIAILLVKLCCGQTDKRSRTAYPRRLPCNNKVGCRSQRNRAMLHTLEMLLCITNHKSCPYCHKCSHCLSLSLYISYIFLFLFWPQMTINDLE